MHITSPVIETSQILFDWYTQQSVMFLQHKQRTHNYHMRCWYKYEFVFVQFELGFVRIIFFNLDMDVLV